MTGAPAAALGRRTGVAMNNQRLEDTGRPTGGEGTEAGNIQLPLPRCGPPELNSPRRGPGHANAWPGVKTEAAPPALLATRASLLAWLPPCCSVAHGVGSLWGHAAGTIQPPCSPTFLSALSRSAFFSGCRDRPGGSTGSG